MENGDLELGDAGMIQDTVQSLLDYVKVEENDTNMFSPSIQMAPRTLRDLSPSSFNPQMVSIGPLHREDENVQAFEKQKIIYLINLIRRTKSPLDEILNLCVTKVYSSIDQIKACYIWTKTYSDAEIAHMMVMDACFILGFVHKIWESDNQSYSGNMLLAVTIVYDLVLLENQIPFFILDELFQCTILRFEPDTSLVELLYGILSFLNIFESDINIDNVSITNATHILSLLHQCYKPQTNFTPTDSFSSIIHSAVDLDRAGVNFKPNQDPTWMMGMEVKFHRLSRFFGSWSKPTLTMPILCVADCTESILRNLVAYEQQLKQTHNYITSYAYAMDMLVDTQEDVAKLIRSGVFVNYMGSNEEAANMINGICKQVACVDFYYDEQWKTLNEYCNGYWPKKIAWLRRTYFSSPWNMIALVAGIILFVLTVVQTIFTINSNGSNK